MKLLEKINKFILEAESAEIADFELLSSNFVEICYLTIADPKIVERNGRYFLKIWNFHVLCRVNGMELSVADYLTALKSFQKLLAKSINHDYYPSPYFEEKYGGIEKVPSNVDSDFLWKLASYCKEREPKPYKCLIKYLVRTSNVADGSTEEMILKFGDPDPNFTLLILLIYNMRTMARK